jgi:hypothetical protein
MSAEIEAIGPFQRRAARTISNAALFDLVEDMAKKVDRLEHVERKVDMILEKLNGLETR